jgi:CHAD domain-containing protein
VISEAVEVEQKFDTPDGFVFPDPQALQDALAETIGPVQVRDDGTVQLSATYFDTFDLRLAKDKVTLRRRTGGKDAGWHLKLPGDGDGRREITAPLGRARSVPTELLDLVHAVVRTEALHPVATLKTRRRVLTVLSEDGQPLIEVVDDRVSATRQTAQDGVASPVEIWRELEAEVLEAGDDDVLAAVGEVLKRAGARPSAAPSKLARALGPIGPPLIAPPPESVSPKAPVAEVVAAYAAQHVRAMQLQDRRLRQDLPDSVHKMRVSARRLRSTLKTFQPILDPAAVAALEPELRWLGMVLGEARDREVLLERLQQDLADVPAELVLGNVSARLEQTLLPELLTAVEQAKAELRGERYLQLLDALVAFAAQPPVTTNKSAAKVLPDLGDRAWRKVRRRMRALTPDVLRAEDDSLHAVRKAAKQARYAGEAMVVVYGDSAGKFAAAMESVQELLGEHQDSTVARDLLRRLGAGNRNGFTFGLLYGREENRARAARTELPAVWENASEKKLRRWMDRN